MASARRSAAIAVARDGPARIGRPEVGRGVPVLLGADDELGEAVVDVVGDAFALLFLRTDRLLDERGERALANGLLPPRPERERGRREDEGDL